MLKPAEAQKELLKHQRQDWVEFRIKDLGKLPATARALGHAVLGHDENGAARQWNKQYQERQKAAARLDKESPAVRRKILAAARSEGWELMEKTLLAAQRQEGLRQTILEIVDEAHPDAFRRMLRLVLEHDLVRFSSVVRAVDVWFGFQWDSVSTGVVNKAIEQALKFLDDADAREKAIKKGQGDDLYLALW